MRGAGVASMWGYLAIKKVQGNNYRLMKSISFTYSSRLQRYPV